jgi:transposase InsO family protein
MIAYIESRRGVFGIEPTCDALGVATNTHYARLSRRPSARAVRDAELICEIHAAREGYRSVYGVRKTWKQLRRCGVTDAGRERVARLMRAEGLRGVQRGKKRRTTTPDEAASDRARDLPFPTRGTRWGERVAGLTRRALAAPLAIPKVRLGVVTAGRSAFRPLGWRTPSGATRECPTSQR